MPMLYKLVPETAKLNPESTPNEPLQELIEHHWLFQPIDQGTGGANQCALNVDYHRGLLINGQKPLTDESLDAFLNRSMNDKTLIPTLKQHYMQTIDGIFPAIANNALTHRTDSEPSRREFKLGADVKRPLPRTLLINERNGELYFDIRFERLDCFDVEGDTFTTLPGTVHLTTMLTPNGFKLIELCTSNFFLYSFLFKHNALQPNPEQITYAAQEEKLTEAFMDCCQLNTKIKQSAMPQFNFIRQFVISLNHCTTCHDISMEQARIILQKTITFLQMKPRATLEDGADFMMSLQGVLSKRPITTSDYILSGVEITAAAALIGAMYFLNSGENTSGTVNSILNNVATCGTTLIAGDLVRRQAMGKFFADKSIPKTQQLTQLVKNTEAFVRFVTIDCKDEIALQNRDPGMFPI